MLKKIQKYLHSHFFSPDTPLDGRMFNFALTFGFVGSILGLASTVAQASSVFAILSTAMLPAIIVVLLLLTNKTRKYRLGGLLVSIVFCDIGFPSVFFMSGGVRSGMLAYMLLGVVIITVLLNGIDVLVMLALYILICAACFLAQYNGWLTVTPIATEELFYTDITVAFVVSSIMIGLVLKYQQYEYERMRRAAEAASKSKSDFLSNMSHEMRTPMNAIIGMTAIAKGASGAGRKDDCLNKIESASVHLLGVINDILDMSKIEANKFDISPVEFDFERLLQKTADVINFRIEDKQQKFTVSVDKDIPRNLIGDDQRLTQVITNLLSNAVKFTPEKGSVRLDANLIDDDGDICRILIKVSDTGIGISKEQQDRLFKSFQQAESSTSRKFGGTGLGLAISKRIVELMDGEIWVESELGKGSSFIFTFRVRRGANDDRALGDFGERVCGETASETDDFSAYRILLAEDVEINREIVLALLEPTGLAIDCAENGAAALVIFGASPDSYDMIFMDVQMPEMDGYEATRRIRALDTARAKSIPIIAMTANVFREDVEKCLEAGMNDHLGKPIDFDEVLGKLRSYLGGKDDAASAFGTLG
ncbi:MAG: response regulator [Clostridiales Family XIII bacterium]|jgi:signal transduction histidine kinase|nr:response regulator [Clostridiales Family XIII bacterium]